MAKKNTTSIDHVSWQESVQRQFRNLDTKDPSLWPRIPKILLCSLIVIAVAVVLWFAKLQDYRDELEAVQAKEISLRADYVTKMNKAVSLELLKNQREQVQQYVIQLEKQLPSKAEMAALLSDINQAGVGRSLQFELFRPSSEIARPYYIELPIAIRVTGSYSDMGAFAADIANLSRIVTLNDIAIAAKDKSNDGLTLDATARTFRYLDADEIEAQRIATQGAEK